MQCTACSKDNRDDALFCRGCGRPFAPACPGCGAELPGDAAFCDRCGTRVSTSPAPSPDSYTPDHLAARIRATRSAIEGERKLVTVLFADIVGSTAIAEKIGAEAMRSLTDRCFGHMLDEVHRFEGTVNQFTGDGVMALFGAPLALEDAPREAVLAGMAIQRSLASCRDELRSTTGIDLQVRIGIHTGLVVFGRIGNDLRVEYTAIGDTINLASRLQTLAEPGTVVISEATHRLVAPFFEVRELGRHAVRGRTDAVHVFEVIAERAARDRVDARAAEGLTPLAGRTGELDALRAAFASARSGDGRIVFVVGEAGIGKSRLLYEFRRGLGEPHTWLEGRCTSYGRTTAFLPIIDLCRRALRIEDTDDERAAARKVDQGVAALGADLVWTAPLVKQLLSLPSGDATADALDAARRRAETFRALKAITLRMAERQPVVLLVEDMHWIDDASEEYLGFFADAVAGARVLVLFTHRPGYRQPFGDRSYHGRVVLHALTRQEMSAMAGAILKAGDIPPELQALIAAKAEGNPLFVEEVTKSLFEEGVLVRRGDRVVLTRPLDDVSVPDSIHGVLMARLDRLGDEPKRALQMASVIGREFALRLLARVIEVGEGVSQLVTELRSLELIYEKAVHPELAYMFKHALTHDVAYDSILVQRRKELHRTIGQAIEQLYDDRLAEHYETLALHFTRGEDWPRAFAYHTLAARKSLAGYANHAAVAHCREALAVADRLGVVVTAAERCNLEEMLGAASMWITEFAQSGEAFRRAAGYAETPARRSLALGWAGHSFAWAHDYQTARKVVREAASLALDHGVAAGRALALAVEGFTDAVTGGDVRRVLSANEQALTLAMECGDDLVLGVAHYMNGEIFEWRGDFTTAIPHLEKALEIGKRIGHPFLLVMPHWWIGKVRCGLGQYEPALVELREGEAVCARIGNRAWQSRLLNTIGWCLAEIGDQANARGYNLEARRLAQDLGDPEILANSEINLALNHLALGDVETAESQLAPLAAALDVPGDPWMKWRYSLHVRDALGRVALFRRQPEEALALANRELAGARPLELKRIIVRALALRARALLDLDRRTDAAEASNEALSLAESIGYPPGQWHALRMLAEVAERNGRGGDAQALRSGARTRMETVAAGLPGDLAQLLRAGAKI